MSITKDVSCQLFYDLDFVYANIICLLKFIHKLIKKKNISSSYNLATCKETTGFKMKMCSSHVNKNTEMK